MLCCCGGGGGGGSGGGSGNGGGGDDGGDINQNTAIYTNNFRHRSLQFSLKIANV